MVSFKQLTGTLLVDTISEKTPAAGVTADGVLMKDYETTARSSVSANAVDGEATLQTIENTQANAGGSTNEVATQLFKFGGVNAAKISIGKLGDFTPSSDADAYATLGVSDSSTMVEVMRWQTAADGNSKIRIGIGQPSPAYTMDFQSALNELDAPSLHMGTNDGSNYPIHFNIAAHGGNSVATWGTVGLAYSTTIECTRSSLAGGTLRIGAASGVVIHGNKSTEATLGVALSAVTVTGLLHVYPQAEDQGIDIQRTNKFEFQVHSPSSTAVWGAVALSNSCTINASRAGANDGVLRILSYGTYIHADLYTSYDTMLAVLRPYNGSIGTILFGTPTVPTYCPRVHIGGTAPHNPNKDIYGLSVAANITTDATGTHALMAQVYVGTPTVTAGGAAVTATATLYVQGAMTVGSNNYALFVDAGLVRLDGSLVIGAATQVDGSLLDIEGSVTGAVDTDIYGSVFSTDFTEAGSGTHALIAQVKIETGTVTGAAATVTNTASLYIAGAMSATVAGANYSLWVDAGDARFDGNVGIGVTAMTSALDVAGDVEIGSANAFYLGDPTTDGSWRFIRSGNNLVVDRRETGAWVTKQTYIP